MAAGVKISELPAANAANDADQIEVNQGGTTRRVTLNQIGSYFSGTGAGGVTINVDALLTGSDTADPMAQLQALFNSGELDGKHAIFGANGRRYVFTTRPTARGPQNQYLVPPQTCTLEWAPGCVWDFSAYPTTGITAPVYIRRDGSYGPVVPLAGGAARGDKAIVLAPGGAAGLVRSQRVLLRCRTQQATLVGAFTLADNVGVAITASIAGSTMQVTAAAAFSIVLGAEIVGPGVAVNTMVTAFGSGTGDVGSYTVSIAQSVPSTALKSHKGYAARGEDVIVKDVVGDTVNLMGALQDTYDASALPCIQTYVNEPRLRFINLSADGPGIGASNNDDRLLQIDLARDVEVIGGTVSNMPYSHRLFGVRGGRLEGVTVHGIKQGGPGGGIAYGDCMSDFLIADCTTYNGGQVFMHSSTGGFYGVTRDVLLRDCKTYNPFNGFSTHNMGESLNFLRCIVRDPRGHGIDNRCRAVTFTACEVTGARQSQAMVVRVNPSNLVVDGLIARDCLTGIRLENFGNTPYDYPPHDLTVRNCELLNIGGLGGAGALSFKYDQLPSGVPVLGSLVLENNRITVVDGATAVSVKGRWTAPQIRGNRVFVGDYGTGAGSAFEIDAPDDNDLPGNGPSDVTFIDNVQGPTFIPWSIVQTTGRTVARGNAVAGVTSTGVVALTANTTLLLSNSGGVFTNAAATAPIVVTLPRATIHLEPVRFRFRVVAGQALEIRSAGYDRIQIAHGAGGFNIKSAVVDADITLTALSTSLWDAAPSVAADWTQDWTPLAIAGVGPWYHMAPAFISHTDPDGDGIQTAVRWADRMNGGSVLQESTVDSSVGPVLAAAWLDFAGGKYLTDQSIEGNFAHGAQPGCLFAICKQTAPPTNTATKVLFAIGGGSGTTQRALRRSVQAGVNRFHPLVGNGASAVNTYVTTVDFSGWHWVGLIVTGTQMVVVCDGVEMAPVAVVPATTEDRARVGDDSNSGTTPLFPWNDKAALIMQTPTLSAGDKASLYAWLTAQTAALAALDP